MSIGSNIKKARGHIKQSELAEMLNVDVSTISRWENDRNIPNGKILKQIADVLKTTTDYLSGETNSPVPVNIGLPHHENNYNTRELPNRSYWGGVADNARNVAKYGNEADKADVCQMLKRALSALIQTTEPPANVDIHHNDMSQASLKF